MTENQMLSEINRVLNIESSTISNLLQTLDEQSIVSIIQALAECKGKIILSGCGTSATACRKIAHSLCCIERPALFLSPADAVHGALGVLQEEDILILISKGGNTSELVNLIPACKAKKAKLICVSENPNSALAKHADLFLLIKIEREPCPFNMLATASTLATISIFDAICIVLMQYTHFTREQFAIIHPSGAVGDRLLAGKE